MARDLSSNATRPIMQIGDYTAHIFVDNEGLEEYGVEFETPTRAVCWVASEEGKVTTHLASHPLFLPPPHARHQQNFCIQWHCQTEIRKKGNIGWVRVDGTFCGGCPMHPGRIGHGDTADMDSIDLGTKTRDFMFSRIQLSGSFFLCCKNMWSD